MAQPSVLASNAPRRSAYRAAAFFAVCLWVVFSTNYWALSKYDIWDGATGGHDGDVGNYVRMMEGAPLDTIVAPLRYRVVVPWVAALMPQTVPGAGSYFALTPDRVIALKFGALNIVGLTVTAFLLYFLALGFGLARFEAVLTVILFTTAYYTVNYGAVPLVDAWAFASLTAALLALQQRRFAWFAAIAAIGFFIKETMILAPLFGWFIVPAARDRWRLAVAVAPGLIAYGAFRLMLQPVDGAGESAALLDQFQHPRRLWAVLFEGVQTYGIFWLFAVAAWCSRDARMTALRRCWPVLLFIAVLPFLISSNIGRIWFLSFPVVLPLAAAGLVRYFMPMNPATDGITP